MVHRAFRLTLRCLLGWVAALAFSVGCDCSDEKYALELWFRDCDRACAEVTGQGRIQGSRLHSNWDVVFVDGQVTLEWSAERFAHFGTSRLADKLNPLTVFLPDWKKMPRVELLGDCPNASAEIWLLQVEPKDAYKKYNEIMYRPVEHSSGLELTLNHRATGASQIHTYSALIQMSDLSKGYVLSRVRVTLESDGCEIFAVRVLREPMPVPCDG